METIKVVAEIQPEFFAGTPQEEVGFQSLEINGQKVSPFGDLGWFNLVNDSLLQSKNGVFGVALQE